MTGFKTLVDVHWAGADRALNGQFGHDTQCPFSTDEKLLHVIPAMKGCAGDLVSLMSHLTCDVHAADLQTADELVALRLTENF